MQFDEFFYKLKTPMSTSLCPAARNRNYENFPSIKKKCLLRVEG